MPSVLTNSSGVPLIGPAGVLGDVARPAGFVDRISITVEAGGSVRVENASVSAGVTRIWIGASRRALIDLTLPVTSIPASALTSATTLGDETFFAGADGEGATLTFPLNLAEAGVYDAGGDPGDPTPTAPAVTAAATLAFSPRAEEGATFTYTAPTVSGTPFAGPTIQWEQKVGQSGSWSNISAWSGGTVPSLTNTVFVRIGTTITPASGDVPVTTYSPEYQVAALTELKTLGASDVTMLRSEPKPASQSVTFSPIVAFPGLSGETVGEIQFTREATVDDDGDWHPVVAGAATGEFQLRHTNESGLAANAYNASLFTEADSTSRNRLKFRWRQVAGSGAWSPTSVAYSVPIPTTASDPTALPLVPQATITAAQTSSGGWTASSFRQASSIPSSGGGTNTSGHADAFQQIRLFAYALAGWQQDTAGASYTAYGGLTPRDFMLNCARYFAATNDENRMPPAKGGVTGQFEFVWCCAMAMAKITPSVWAALTDAEKRRIDLGIKACFVQFAWQNSDNNPHVLSGRSSNERTIRGMDWARGRVPNYTLGSYLGTHVCALFLGGADAGNAFLKAFRRADFAEELRTAVLVSAGPPATYRAGVLQEAYDTFRQNWTSEAKVGPTAAELEAAICQPAVGGVKGNHRCLGFELKDYDAMLLSRFDHMFRGTIRPGFVATSSTDMGNGATFDANAVYGFTEPASKTGVPRPTGGRGALVGRLQNTAVWPNLPNAGVVGQCAEFQDSDGGGFSPSAGAGPRSSMHYVFKGMDLAIAGLAVFAAYKAINRATVRRVLERFERGAIDLEFKRVNGPYRNFANGGRLYLAPARANEDHDATSTSAYNATTGGFNWSPAVRNSLARDVLSVWGLRPANTAVPTISGTVRVGQVLTATDGTWATGSGAASIEQIPRTTTKALGNTFTRQWQSEEASGWTNISGAAGSTFTPTTTQQGKRLRCAVTATNGYGAVQVFSAATVAVAA